MGLGKCGMSPMCWSEVVSQSPIVVRHKKINVIPKKRGHTLVKAPGGMPSVRSYPVYQPKIFFGVKVYLRARLLSDTKGYYHSKIGKGTPQKALSQIPHVQE